MRIAIVDDVQRERDVLSDYLRRFAAENDCCIEVDQFSSAEELLDGYRMIYDILIFDIDMPGVNGIEAARQIRVKDKNTVLLFVTNVAQYAINGYEVDAIDYIIKPISYYDFTLKFHRAIGKAAQRKDVVIVLETSEGTRKVKISQIMYVEALGHYLIYHVGEHAYRVRGNIKNHEQQLRTYNFCQIHKSYLVNMEHIEEIRTGELLIAGITLSIGRVYKETLLQRYFKYVRG